MNIDFHLQRIAASSRSMETLYFRPSGTFSNALLRSRDITALIRDADDNEAALFSLAQNDVLSKVAATAELISSSNTNTGSPSRYQQSKAHTVPDGNSATQVEFLCNTIENICQAYPMNGVLEKVQKYRERSRILQQNISEYEQVVIAQRDEIKVLSEELDSAKQLRYQRIALEPELIDDDQGKPTEEQITVEEAMLQMEQLQKEIQLLRAES